jgi:hypothetical protein
MSEGHMPTKYGQVYNQTGMSIHLFLDVPSDNATSNRQQVKQDSVKPICEIQIDKL